MGTSGARRQTAYRQRHLKDAAGALERLHLLVSIAAKRQLKRLAYGDGVTQQAMLERLLATAERTPSTHSRPRSRATISRSTVRYAVTSRHRPAGPEPGDRFRLPPGSLASRDRACFVSGFRGRDPSRVRIAPRTRASVRSRPACSARARRSIGNEPATRPGVAFSGKHRSIRKSRTQVLPLPCPA
jgi:hypothetical protein